MTDPTPQTTPTRDEAVEAVVDRVEDVVLADWFRHTSDPKASRRVVVRAVVSRMISCGGVAAVPSELRKLAENAIPYREGTTYFDSAKDRDRFIDLAVPFIECLASAPAPASGRVDAVALPDDLFSHQASWRAALVLARDSAPPAQEDFDDRAYWQHELDVFDRVYVSLSPAATPVSEAGGEPVASEDIAKIVYAAMKWAAERAESGKPPRWVERGNSLAQTEARRFAIDIAAIPKPAAARGALERMVSWYGKRGGDDELLPPNHQDAEVAQAMSVLDATTASLMPCSESLREALTIVRQARAAHAKTIRMQTIAGETDAERRASEGEARDYAAEVMFGELGSLTFEHLDAIHEALAKPASSPAGG